MTPPTGEQLVQIQYSSTGKPMEANGTDLLIVVRDGPPGDSGVTMALWSLWS